MPPFFFISATIASKMNASLIPCLFVLFIGAYSSSVMSVVKDQYFSCDPVRPEYVKIFGIEFTCSDDKVCNLFDINTGGERSPPCIAKADLCQDRFACTEDGKVEFKNVAFTYECGQRQVCNKDYRLPCYECVCGGFKCANESMVLIDGWGPHPCPEGKVCNVHNVAPCDVCVNK